MSTSDVIDEKMIHEFYEIHRFKGFDKRKIREEFLSKFQDKTLRTEILVACSSVSPARVQHAVMRNGKSLNQLGVISGSKALSPARVVSAFAKEIIQIRKQTKQEKRILDHDCPAEYQVLGVASAIPKELIGVYKDFCMKFTILIGGKFREDLFSLSMN